MLEIKQKKSPREIFSGFQRNLQKIGSLFASDKIAILEELKKQVSDALHFGHPGSIKMLAEKSKHWCSAMRIDIEKKCSKCTACMISDKNLKYQLHSTQKIKLRVLIEPGENT